MFCPLDKILLIAEGSLLAVSACTSSDAIFDAESEDWIQH